MSKEQTTEHPWGCDGEHADASFCSGPSENSNPCEYNGTCDHTDPVCEPSERSARGYCPGEEGHRAEVCQLYEDAGEHHSLCVEDGVCREVVSSCGNPATDINAQVTAAPEPSLPDTGAPDMLAGVALAMIALGTGLLRLVRNPA